MTDAGSIDHRRYRRRNQGWGLLALLLALFVAASCVGSDSADDPTATGDVDEVDEVPTSSGPSGSDLVDPSSTSSTPPVTPPVASTTIATDDDGSTGSSPGDDETIADVVAADPQFEQLSSLLRATGFDDTLAVGGPFTVLAPTDAAFDAAFDSLGADAFQDLMSDPDRLRSVLLHHVTPGAIGVDDFVDGPLTMLDGATVVVERSADGGLTFSSGGAVARGVDESPTDIEASNGVIHAIDQVLPASVIDDDVDVAPMGLTIELGAGRIVLSGEVSSQGQRGVLLSAAQQVVTDDDLLDELVVDSSTELTDADVDRAAALIPTFPDRLVAGLITIDDGVRLAGVVVDEDARTAVTAIADEVGADVDLSVSEQPDDGADDAAAAALQAELDALVADTPIEFAPDSTEPTEAGLEVIAAVADLLLGAVEPVPAGAEEVPPPLPAIAIIGHTDSDGDAVRNLLISEGRALRVREELVELGVDGDRLVGVGRGEADPVLGSDGREDKTASRRVEFAVGVGEPSAFGRVGSAGES